MSQREFELYLSLLSKLLGMSASQREAIAAELRDHLESRFEELTANGLSAEEAMQQAIEDLGDASGLAARFMQLAKQQRRRQVMRYSLGSVAGLTLVALVALSLRPHPVGLVRIDVHNADAVIAADVKPGTKSKPELVTEALIDPRRAALEKMLSEANEDVDFNQTPLRDVCDFLVEKWGAPILRDGSADDSAEAQVTLQLPAGVASRHTMLTLILERFDLGVYLREGIIMITRQEDTYEARVYNCRDLLESPTSAPSAAQTRRSSMFSAPGGLGGADLASNAPAEARDDGRNTAPLTVTDQLVETVITAITPGQWQNNGGAATITAFDGLLIVKHKEHGHRAVIDLLQKIRVAHRASPRS